jgi:hypothetical protein
VRAASGRPHAVVTDDGDGESETFHTALKAVALESGLVSGPLRFGRVAYQAMETTDPYGIEEERGR